MKTLLLIGGMFVLMGSAFLILSILGIEPTNGTSPDDIPPEFVFMGLGSLFLPIGIFLFSWGFRQIQDRKRILQHGHTSIATITNIESSMLTVNSVRYINIEIKHQGRVLKVKNIHPKYGKNKSIGDQISIMLDPQNPDNFIIP